MTETPADPVFGPSFKTLEDGIARHMKIQEVISQNVANAGTPGYRALVFDDVLDKAVERSNTPQVNLDDEMADLVKNRAAYTTMIRLLTSKINILRTVATQGRR